MSLYLDKLRNYLDDAGVLYQILEHPGAYTAQQQAALAHVPGHAYAKSVIVLADDKPRQMVLSAADQVDLDAVKSYLGAKEVRLAREDEFAHLFPDAELGAMPAVSATSRVPISR